MTLARSAPAVLAIMAAVLAPAAAQGPAMPPYSPDALAPPAAPPRSVVFDRQRARDLAPVFVERIDVEGVDPDARRPKPKSVEQRFADALNAPRTSALGNVMKPLDARPCPSLPSTHTNVGTAYNPYGFCPQ